MEHCQGADDYTRAHAQMLVKGVPPHANHATYPQAEDFFFFSGFTAVKRQQEQQRSLSLRGRPDRRQRGSREGRSGADDDEKRRTRARDVKTRRAVAYSARAVKNSEGGKSLARSTNVCKPMHILVSIERAVHASAQCATEKKLRVLDSPYIHPITE